MNFASFANQPQAVLPRSGEVPSEEVLYVTKIRRGRILGHDRMLKGDLFPSGRDKSLGDQIDEAPNFRPSTSNGRVYGTGQPSVRGLKSVVGHLWKSNGGAAPVTWINMRQEPMVYINGKPFCVKDRDAPFQNLEQPGITASGVREREHLLKYEILAEASHFGGSILLHGERDVVPAGGDALRELAAWGEVYAYWEKVETVETVEDVFEQLDRELQVARQASHAASKAANQLLASAGARSSEASGKAVEFFRVPVPDEKSPDPEHYDALAEALFGKRDGGRAPDLQQGLVVFNCQLGRGRTTTGMSAACMLLACGPSTPLVEGDHSAERADTPPPLILGSLRRAFVGSGGDSPQTVAGTCPASPSPPTASSVDSMVAPLLAAMRGEGPSRAILVAGKKAADPPCPCPAQQFADGAIAGCARLQDIKAAVAVRADKAVSHAEAARAALLQSSAEEGPRDAKRQRVDITEMRKFLNKERGELEVGTQYLLRYASLVLLAECLLDRHDAGESREDPNERAVLGFSTWLKTHPNTFKILGCLNNLSLCPGS